MMNTTAYISQSSYRTRRAPYLKEVPLVGSLGEFGSHRLELFERLASTADVCGMHLGPYSLINFNRPEYVQVILLDHSDEFDKGAANHRTFRPVIGNGILCSEGTFHDSQRKSMAPAFLPTRVSDYADNLVQYAEELQASWEDGARVDIHQSMMDLSMRIIGKALFDADFLRETDALGKGLLTTAEHIAHSLTTLIPVPYSWPLPRNIRTKQSQKWLRAEIDALIRDRRANPPSRVDFLTLLVLARDEHGKPMSDEQIMAECLTLFGAGQEPPASALTWAWYLLGHYPAVYDKVREEVDRVLKGRPPRHEDLDNLPYCRQVLRETLRIYPPAYMIARRALRNLDVCGYRVRRGDMVMTNPWTLHRRKEYFPDPELFDPERFSEAREKSIPRHGYIPFGAGPRTCIGNHYALMVGHLALATIAQRVEFGLVPGQAVIPDPYSSPSLRPGGPVHVRVKRR